MDEVNVSEMFNFKTHEWVGDESGKYVNGFGFVKVVTGSHFDWSHRKVYAETSSRNFQKSQNDLQVTLQVDNRESFTEDYQTAI